MDRKSPFFLENSWDLGWCGWSIVSGWCVVMLHFGFPNTPSEHGFYNDFKADLGLMKFSELASLEIYNEQTRQVKWKVETWWNMNHRPPGDKDYCWTIENRGINWILKTKKTHSDVGNEQKTSATAVLGHPNPTASQGLNLCVQGRWLTCQT